MGTKLLLLLSLVDLLTLGLSVYQLAKLVCTYETEFFSLFCISFISTVGVVGSFAARAGFAAPLGWFWNCTALIGLVPALVLCLSAMVWPCWAALKTLATSAVTRLPKRFTDHSGYVLPERFLGMLLLVLILAWVTGAGGYGVLERKLDLQKFFVVFIGRVSEAVLDNDFHNANSIACFLGTLGTVTIYCLALVVLPLIVALVSTVLTFGLEDSPPVSGGLSPGAYRYPPVGYYQKNFTGSDTYPGP